MWVPHAALLLHLATNCREILLDKSKLQGIPNLLFSFFVWLSWQPSSRLYWCYHFLQWNQEDRRAICCPLDHSLWSLLLFCSATINVKINLTNFSCQITTYWLRFRWDTSLFRQRQILLFCLFRNLGRRWLSRSFLCLCLLIGLSLHLWLLNLGLLWLNFLIFLVGIYFATFQRRLLTVHILLWRACFVCNNFYVSRANYLFFVTSLTLSLIFNFRHRLFTAVGRNRLFAAVGIISRLTVITTVSFQFKSSLL